MKSIFKVFCIVVILSSCSSFFGGRHLREKVFTNKDITVKWYQISTITTVDDFIDIERWGWEKTIMKANTGGIYNILIKGDTVIIQTRPDLIIYDLMAKTQECCIKLDTSITVCQYLKKFMPESAGAYCDENISDTISKK